MVQYNILCILVLSWHYFSLLVYNNGASLAPVMQWCVTEVKLRFWDLWTAHLYSSAVLFSIVDPRWASVNRGVLICDECCSVHRSLGRHSSQVRHLTHTPWPPNQLQVRHTRRSAHKRANTNTKASGKEHTHAHTHTLPGLPISSRTNWPLNQLRDSSWSASYRPNTGMLYLNKQLSGVRSVHPI